ARVLAVDASPARALPGVVAAWSAADLALPDYPESPSLEITPRPRPLLARQVVRYTGEPLAIVVAEDRYQAHDALAVIEADLDPPQVRVLAEDVGGGFGAKTRCYPEEILTAVAALRLGRPVSWVGSRSDDTASTTQAHGTVLDLELAADPEGGLRGLRGHVLQ